MHPSNIVKSLRIADAIVTWPPELCRIVADYSLPTVRWSDRQKIGIIVSSDGLNAEIADGDRFEYSFVDGTTYMRLIAESPLRETAIDWTLKMIVRTVPISAVFRIGVETDNTFVLSPKIRFLATYVDEKPVLTSLNAADLDPETIRFSLSADLRTGRLRIGVKSTTIAFADSDDWFTETIEPERLAAAVPVVYFYGPRSSVSLVDKPIFC